MWCSRYILLNRSYLTLLNHSDNTRYVMDYEGVKRRESQVHGTNRERSAEYRKFRTHVLKIGRYLIDASDTKRFPAGLLNTCPKGANSCSVRGKTVTLTRAAPVNTMLCINYGKSYITENFIKFKCYPLNELEEKQKREKKREELMKRICTCNKPRGNRIIVRCSNSMPESEKRDRRRELKALQRKREEKLMRRKTLKQNPMKCTWCSSAKRENFNNFSLLCFCYITQITRMSLVLLTQYCTRKSLENQCSSAHSVVTNT